MIQKQSFNVIKGMRQDISPSKANPEYIFDARNIRLTARGNDTLLSITNEQGSKKIYAPTSTIAQPIDLIKGKVLGYCVLNNYLVTFSTDTMYSGDIVDYITRVYMANNVWFSDILYSSHSFVQNKNGEKEFKEVSGRLNFGDNIQTLGVYENENIQKVYWVDEINQPRVINIVKEQLKNKSVEDIAKSYKNTSFDFVPELQLKESIEVSTILGGNGRFSAGTIQYAFTYYNKYGQESNIFYVSDLNYVTFPDRGGSAENIITNSFKITIKDIDPNFEYIRVYSIHRTSIDATPEIKKVIDISTDVVKPNITSEVTNTYTRVGLNIPISVSLKKKDKVDYSDYADLSTYSSFLQSVSNSQIPAASGNYYVFNKSEYDGIKIRFLNNIVTYDTCDSIYISQTNVGGPGATNERLITVNKATGSLLKIQTYEEKADSITYIDNNSLGEAVDPTFLLYVGGEDIIAKTLSQKDNTLFLGNITLNKPIISQSIKDKLLEQEQGQYIKTSYREVKCQSNKGSFYKYSNQLVSGNTCTFKNKEHYRLGVQFQYKNGKWSEPVVTNYAYTVDQKPSVTDGNMDIYRLPKLTLTINKDIANELINLGFRKVRTLVVNPSLQDRKVILQGMVCPTVYNKKNRESEAPYSQSSWFLRPYVGCKEVVSNTATRETLEIDNSSSTTLSKTKLDMGANVMCAAGYRLIKQSWSIPPSATGQSFSSYLNSRGVEIENADSSEDSTSDFIVDQNIVTLHSPDIEFDNSIATLGGTELKCRFVGYIPFISNTGDISIQTSSPPIGDKSTGFYHKTLTVKNNLYAGRSLVSGLFYRDYVVDDSGDADKYKQHPNQSYEYSWMIYPWQCSGSLNNDVNRPTNSGTRSAVLKRKVISNLKYATNTRWFTVNDSINGTTGKDVINQDIYPIQIFNSNEVTLTKINQHNYYGNVNTLLMSDKLVTKKVGVGRSSSVKCAWTHANIDLYENKNTESTFYDDCILTMTLANKFSFKGDIADLDTKLIEQKSSVLMKYKSTPHIVMQFKDNYIPPVFINNDTNKTPFDINAPILKRESTQSEFSYNTVVDYPQQAYLFMAELYRDNVENPFGGNSTDAIKSNLWIPSGTAVPLYQENQDGGSQVNTNVDYLHGDCYYQRYDCLKTYPFTNEDENSIVEIGSFMVETRVNIDGRYDRNRGLISNLNMSPQNFNLINNIYTQKDNFFNYRILDSDQYKLNNFPNTITWSKEKTLAEDVDTWANITMTNTFDMDGNLGQIQSIENYNNELYCFQDKGISRILFNNRVQIPTGDNVPIEISNGYKVQGKVYLSNTVGCQNQKAIKVTPNGIYFSDLYNSGIYLLNQQGMQDISTPRGFTNWVKECQPDRLHYDANNGDLYLMGNGYSNNFYKNCLCFSEKINEFTSFMDYYSNKYMFNIQNNFYAIKDYDVYHNSGTHFMQMFSGDYMKDYHITYIANQNPTNDKIFNTLEFRADTLKPDDKLVISDINSKSPNICPFNKLTIWNEYQEGTAELSKILGKPSNLKEKFRTWRVNIPRDKSNNRDRIRNPWAYIKLEGSNNTNRMQLHDLQVWYYDNSVYGYNQRQQ